MSDELVEVWRGEFHEIMSRDSPFRSIDFIPGTKTYADEETCNLWFGFLMAKRSQPVIEIDKLSRFGTTDDILCCITAAGYQYKVKE